ncbi:efflux RND transporter periplasmic adaptor subunit [Thermoanaerobacter sp. X514]|uniref:efflux RND transporter periplasmic adaptor subunit n=1 Tax=Thermoanaerobacter sp. (strain X514) TaxID=399726 RepID=UPI0000E1D96F|nr:efflux RND transporter periplasmic adaptor subunit [Thermoanaerobacter sp. X514]ABY91516.1 efflux transporter, RND family, MFP subunit [Thermoanaerobacter sp. X514]
MKRKYLYAIVAVLIIGIATFYFVNRAKSSQPQQLSYVTVTRGNISMEVTGTGNLSGDVRAITLKGSGTVKKVYFKVGDTVKKGDLLYEIEDDDLNNQLEEAKLNLDLAQQQLNQEKQNYNNSLAKLSITAPSDGVVQVLVKEGQDVTPGMPVAIIGDNSKENETAENNGQTTQNSVNVTAQIAGTVEKVYVSQGQNVKKGQLLIKLSSNNISDAQIKNAELKLKQAQNQYNQILQQIDNLKIYSPIDGKILSQNINEGDILGTSVASTNISNTNSQSQQAGFVPVLDITQLSTYESQPETAVIVGNSNYVVNLSVDETDIKNIKVGQQAQLTTDNLPGKTFTGTVSQVSQLPTIQNGVASYNVTIEVEPSEDLLLGMSMNVSITVAEKQDALILPIQAVQTNGDRKYVILYTNDLKNQNINSTNNSTNNRNSFRNNMRFVETGIYNDNFIEIVSGLQEGDKVLIPTLNSSTNANNSNLGGFGGMGGFRPGGNFNGNSTSQGGSYPGGSFNRTWQNNSSQGR